MTVKTYTGTKTVHAKPMTRADYNLLRGWTVPADENPADAGYLVEYLDGGKANVPGFEGYVSWSPAEVFERSYREVPPLVVPNLPAGPAPRVSLAELEANIVHTDIVKHVSQSGQVLRWAVLTTRNGFAVTGRPSAAVSPANDNAAMGEEIAIDNARNELWPLMGYELRSKLAAA